MAQGSIRQHIALDSAKVRLRPLCANIWRDGLALPRSMASSMSCTSTRGARERPRDGRFARAHEARPDISCPPSRDEPLERLEERRVGHGDRVGALMVVGRLTGKRGDGKRHRHPVIAAGVGDCRPWACRRSVESTNPSGISSASTPSARKPATRTAMRSLSLTRSSPAPRDGQTAAERRAAPRSPGSSSMRPGTSSGAISTVPVRSPSTMMRPCGSPAVEPASFNFVPGAEAPQHTDERRSRRIQARRRRSRPESRAATQRPPSRRRQTKSRPARPVAGRWRAGRSLTETCRR